MTTNKHTSGFTLIELLLAMTFISFLLIFMVAAILQVTKLYVKGSAIRQINQTGHQLMDDVASSLRTGATPTLIDANNRLCVGGTSYVWNIDGDVSKPINKFAAPNASTVLRFVSVQDPLATLCDTPTNAVSKTNSLDLVGPETTPLSFSITPQGRLWTVSLVLSTSGSDNVATLDTATGRFACDPQNQFCAFGEFVTSIYSRTGE